MKIITKSINLYFLHQLRQRVLILVLLVLSSSSTLLARDLANERVSQLKFTNQSLTDALRQLGEATDSKLVFNHDVLNQYEVSASLENLSVTECLTKLLKDIPVSYSVKGDVIIIAEKPQVVSNEQFKVTGVVVDNEGMPMPGVTILVKNTTTGVATDIDGRFTINVNSPSTMLIFSFIGMETKEVMADTKKEMKVLLASAATMLNEVVATGYQTISRERATGSAVILNTEKLDKIQSSSLVTKLEGVTPGLVNYGGGMSIRGTSSFAVSGTPLLVIDGQVSNLGLNDLNPDDIATITVLKDASATSLYGVRASNGVIVVTSKKAKSDKVHISASAGFYVRPVSDLGYYDYASTSDIIDYERSFIENDPSYIKDPKGYFAELQDMSNPKQVTGIQRLYYDLAHGKIDEDDMEHKIDQMRSNDYRKEYQKEFMRSEFTQDYNLSFSKGGERSNNYFSLRYEDKKLQNIMEDDNRLSLAMNSTYDVAEWFKLAYGANAMFKEENRARNNSSFLEAMPYETLRDEIGNLKYQYFYNYYLAQELEEKEGLKSMRWNAHEEYDKNMEKTDHNYLKLFAHTDFKIAKGLDLGLKFQYEQNSFKRKQYDEVDSYQMRSMINNFASVNQYGAYVYNIPDGGHMEELRQNSSYLNFRGQLNYKTTINGIHDIVALAGGEIRQDDTKQSYSELYGYDDHLLTSKSVDWLTLSSVGVIGQLNSNTQRAYLNQLKYETRHRYISAYANAGYTYDGRFTLNGSVRVEQADLFGTDPKYRYRPLWSVGGSWNMSNESFLSSATWLDALKVRATYGITGNVDQNSSPFLLAVYGNSLYTATEISQIVTPPNKSLRWEKTSTLNFGVDFSLFSRLNASIEYYSRYSSDLLANKRLDPSLGFTEAKFNNGEMKNSGIEMSFSYDWIKSKDWTFNTALTAAYNKNEIKKVGYKPTNAIDMLMYPQSYYLEGDSYNSLYAYQYAGLTAEGNPSIYNEKGEVVSNIPVRNIESLVNTGQLSPKWSGSLNLNLRWKTLEIYSKFVYYTGHSLRNDVTPLYGDMYSYGSGMHKDMVDRWTPENTDTEIPVMGLYTIDADRNHHWKYADSHVRSASFIKCRNIGMSFALPKSLTQAMRMNRISIKAQVDNPFYWAANGEGIDPEAFNANSGARAAAIMPSYIMGINLSF